MAKDEGENRISTSVLNLGRAKGGGRKKNSETHSSYSYVFTYWNRIYVFWTEVNLVADCLFNF